MRIGRTDGQFREGHRHCEERKVRQGMKVLSTSEKERELEDKVNKASFDISAYLRVDNGWNNQLFLRCRRLTLYIKGPNLVSHGTIICTGFARSGVTRVIT